MSNIYFAWPQHQGFAPEILLHFFLALWHWEACWWLNHPVEKYDRQMGNLPQIGMKIQII